MYGATLNKDCLYFKFSIDQSAFKVQYIMKAFLYPTLMASQKNLTTFNTEYD
jgi:hypothetical protein